MPVNYIKTIAKEIRRELGEAQARPDTPQTHLNRLVDNLAYEFSKGNPYFDKKKFVRKATE